MRSLHRLVLAGLAGLSLFASALGAHAQLTVYDPWNYIEAYQTVTQSLQQIQQLESQLQAQEAMLQHLGSDFTQPLAAINSQAASILQQAQGLGFSSSSIASQFGSTYPTSVSGMSGAQISAALSAWHNATSQSMQTALSTQNQVAQSQSTATTAAQNAVAASNAAAGQTGAIQATNQLLATVSSQLTQLEDILITQARAQEMLAAQQQSDAVAATANFDAANAAVNDQPATPPPGVTDTSNL
jgi:P-type conjugative transfer protein TrbJ